MITSSRLIQQADTDGVPTPTVERDYVLTHVLAAIASTLDQHVSDEPPPFVATECAVRRALRLYL